jgi:hypothetical protein
MKVDDDCRMILFDLIFWVCSIGLFDEKIMKESERKREGGERSMLLLFVSFIRSCFIEIISTEEEKKMRRKCCSLTLSSLCLLSC